MVSMINAGGSGTRLWPLSTPERPKHLLNLHPEIEESMLQSAYKRAKHISDEVYVITEAGHAHLIREQLPELDDEHIIIEPARRGTASCLVMALDYVSERHQPETAMFMLYADHVIRDLDSFRESALHAMKTSKQHGKITMLGVQPTHPSTGFGYMLRGKRLSAKNTKDIYELKEFKEKPDLMTAEQYVHSGEYLWNTGYFVAPIKVFIDSMKRHSKELHKDFLHLKKSKQKSEDYLGFQERVTERILIEPASLAGELLVVPGSFDWMDIGNFHDLHNASHKDERNNAITGRVEMEDCSGSYVRNDSPMDVAVYGVDDVVVVVNEQGVLVTKRERAHNVGELAKRINGNCQKKKDNKKCAKGS